VIRFFRPSFPLMGFGGSLRGELEGLKSELGSVVLVSKQKQRQIKFFCIFFFLFPIISVCIF